MRDAFEVIETLCRDDSLAAAEEAALELHNMIRR